MSRTARRAAPLALATIAALALVGCTDKPDTPSSSTKAGGSGAITVNATDTACELSASTAQAGTVTFDISNAGTKINEFYVYAAGDRIVSEVENITPGLKRQLKVEITEPGTFTTACKPGMVGDGIRSDFTVTGTAAKGSADQKVAKAISDYRAFVATESDKLLAGTEEFVTAVKAGDVAKAKTLYPTARLPWETIEPVAESFGDLDPRIDGREDVIEDGMKFTGYHRLEKDLWVTGLQADSNAIADQLLVDVKEIATKSKSVEPTALTIANGAKALLDEVATGKITGEEERYSHTDLWDFRGNLQGSQSALETLRPVVTERNPALQKTLDARFGELNKLLESHRVNGSFVSYTKLTAADIKALTVSLDALGEEVSKVPAVVESK
ncbi:peptidase M75 [Humibacillus sp. DSM 29435]|uniref:iron uptake system protein EfeO n=1 Tax=Humibacillus sp. DSM 29435 TaxID=1869167 RepID=UPI000872FCA3|nr:iron uptake system protein EfeO [Humibacillus sp. DSM 29435]OFE17883.1 peptidase M75 [Humibacillus sp. DSM 29435]